MGSCVFTTHPQLVPLFFALHFISSFLHEGEKFMVTIHIIDVPVGCQHALMGWPTSDEDCQGFNRHAERFLFIHLSIYPSIHLYLFFFVAQNSSIHRMLPAQHSGEWSVIGQKRGNRRNVTLQPPTEEMEPITPIQDRAWCVRVCMCV